jgi:4-hydroxybenzoyl-CoA thioesterase
MIFTVDKQIRFHHCDPAGIVFYPQFYVLLHEAQEDFLAHIGFAEHRMIESGYGVPIVDMTTQFLGMCRNGDQITVSLSLTRLGNSSVGMRYRINRGETVALRARAVVVYSKLPDGKPVRIPDDLRQALLPYLEETPQDTP